MTFCALRAAIIDIANGSFESPITVFVDPRIDSWQKSPKPSWYDESGGFSWDQLTGLFINTPPTDPAHIDNCDGSQALFLFAVPDVALFQDYFSTDWNNVGLTHAFDAKFQVGKSYTLDVGVIGGGGNMANGATLQLSLYYREGASNLVTVAATTITNTPALFTNTTHLVDFQVKVPSVQRTDPWADQHIGIGLRSSVRPELAGGYWDLDQVCLSEVCEPSLVGRVSTNGQFVLSLQSELGLRFEILGFTNLWPGTANWLHLGTVTNATGLVHFVDADPGLTQRFFKARQSP